MNLSHAPWHKAPDRYFWIEVVVDRPDHGAPGLVRYSDYGIVWHIDPDHLFGVGFFRQSHTVAAVPGFPVYVVDGMTVGVLTAEALAARQTLEPLVKR